MIARDQRHLASSQERVRVASLPAGGATAIALEDRSCLCRLKGIPARCHTLRQAQLLVRHRPRRNHRVLGLNGSEPKSRSTWATQLLDAQVDKLSLGLLIDRGVLK
jgi:hypothetical protein